MKLSTDPLAWVTGALGNTFSAVVLFYLSFVAGGFSVLYADSAIFMYAMLAIPISIITGWGLVFVPFSIWIFWGLLYEEKNKYILLSLNMLSGAFLCSTHLNEFEFSWYTLPMLGIPAAILFAAGFSSAKKGFHWFRMRKFKDIHFDDH